jgi:IrrE N-terminal-like domain
VEAIEQRAEGVLARVPSWIWDGESVPVPVEAIADSCFQLLVRDVEDMSSAPGSPGIEEGQSLSGLLLASRGEIWVNAAEAREWPPRRRFTIGHELGHWVMHRTGQQALFCRRGTVAPEDQVAETRPPLPVTEEEANAFAAALLMPARLVREHYADCSGDFDELCRRFDSSSAAMGRRLHQTVPRSS